MRDPKFIDFKTALALYVTAMVLTALLLHFVVYARAGTTSGSSEQLRLYPEAGEAHSSAKTLQEQIGVRNGMQVAGFLIREPAHPCAPTHTRQTD